MQVGIRSGGAKRSTNAGARPPQYSEQFLQALKSDVGDFIASVGHAVTEFVDFLPVLQSLSIEGAKRNANVRLSEERLWSWNDCNTVFGALE